jgi:hypothetical protein
MLRGMSHELAHVWLRHTISDPDRVMGPDRSGLTTRKRGTRGAMRCMRGMLGQTK